MASGLTKPAMRVQEPHPNPPAGSTVVVSHRRVIGIAVPMTLAYISTPLLGLVDITVIGQLGQPQLLGAIGVGAIIFDIVFTTFNFLRAATTGLTAQAHGAKDRVEIGATLVRALMIAVISGICLVLLQSPVLEISLAFVGASDQVDDAVRIYFTIRILSAPFALANYAILGWFIGLGRAGVGLALQVFLNGVNMALNAWFVLGLGWGVTGVAWGTVIGEVATAVVGLALVWRQLGGGGLPNLESVLNRSRFLALMALNRDIMIRSFVLIFAFAFFTAESAKQSDLILAANTVLMNFLLIGGYFLDGFATAAEQMVGESLGARQRRPFQRAVRLTFVWSGVMSVIASCVFLIAGSFAIDVITTSPEVREVARQYLLWAAIAPFVGFAAYHFDGVYIGATWSSEMRNMMLLSLIVYLAAWWFLMPAYGNDGLWIAMNVFLGIRGITLSLRYPVRLNRVLPATA